MAGGSRARILMLTTYDADDYVYAAIQAGASGFLLEDAQPAQLVEAIQVIAAGDALLAPSVTRRLLTQFARTLPAGQATTAPALSELTGRETEGLAATRQRSPVPSSPSGCSSAKPPSSAAVPACCASLTSATGSKR